MGEDVAEMDRAIFLVLLHRLPPGGRIDRDQAEAKHFMYGQEGGAKLTLDQGEITGPADLSQPDKERVQPGGKLIRLRRHLRPAALQRFRRRNDPADAEGIAGIRLLGCGQTVVEEKNKIGRGVVHRSSHTRSFRGDGGQLILQRR